jgi:hypothetical protein
VLGVVLQSISSVEASHASPDDGCKPIKIADFRTGADLKVAAGSWIAMVALGATGIQDLRTRPDLTV